MSYTKPRYQHGCNQCVWLGQHDEFDLYYCPQIGLPTIVARYGDDGPDYVSSHIAGRPILWDVPMVNALWVGRLRAEEMGLSLGMVATP